jgi:hypothetical protein
MPANKLIRIQCRITIIAVSRSISGTAKKMNKKTQADIDTNTELLKRVNEAIVESKNYYLCTGYRQELGKLNTAAAKAGVVIHEDTEWDKYGCHITGREVALAELPKLRDAIQQIILELMSGAKVKKDYASTAQGAVEYAKSAIKNWDCRRGNESYRDAEDRMYRESPIAL